jgi:hypothetical protein
MAGLVPATHVLRRRNEEKPCPLATSTGIADQNKLS